MNTFQIAEPILNTYMNDKISLERSELLVAQANEQIDEISQNQEIYNSFLKQVNAPKKADKLILWILFMAYDDICSDYISEFKKDFNDTVPISDLADLLLYVAHLKKVKNIELDGFDYLLEYEGEGIEEVDQYSVTNVLAYIQQSKQVKIEF
jgi:hypothetical protein